MSFSGYQAAPKEAQRLQQLAFVAQHQHELGEQGQPAMAPTEPTEAFGYGLGRSDEEEEVSESESESESEHVHEGFPIVEAASDGPAEPNGEPVVRTVITHVSSEAKSVGTVLTVSIQCLDADGSVDKTVSAFIAGRSDSYVACLEVEGEDVLPCVYLVPPNLLPPKTMALLKQATSQKGCGQLLGTLQAFEANDFVECTVKEGSGSKDGSEVCPGVGGGGGCGGCQHTKQ